MAVFSQRILGKSSKRESHKPETMLCGSQGKTMTVSSRNTPMEKSRIDFHMERGAQKYLLEVKGCTLERDGIGYFPDAPTERGVRHIHELHELIRQHYLYTGSKLARTMLDDWQRYADEFIQVVPIEYKRVLQEEQMRKLQQKIAEVQRDY